MNCEIEVAMNATGTEAYPCNRLSTALCYECGTKICDLHTEQCSLCREFVCPPCMPFHVRQPHEKGMLTVRHIIVRHRSA